MGPCLPTRLVYSSAPTPKKRRPLRRYRHCPRYPCCHALPLCRWGYCHRRPHCHPRCSVTATPEKFCPLRLQRRRSCYLLWRPSRSCVRTQPWHPRSPSSRRAAALSLCLARLLKHTPGTFQVGPFSGSSSIIGSLAIDIAASAADNIWPLHRTSNPRQTQLAKPPRAPYWGFLQFRTGGAIGPRLFLNHRNSRSSGSCRRRNLRVINISPAFGVSEIALRNRMHAAVTMPCPPH